MKHTQFGDVVAGCIDFLDDVLVDAFHDVLRSGHNQGITPFVRNGDYFCIGIAGTGSAASPVASTATGLAAGASEASAGTAAAEEVSKATTTAAPISTL